MDQGSEALHEQGHGLRVVHALRLRVSELRVVAPMLEAIAAEGGHGMDEADGGHGHAARLGVAE